MNQSTLQGLSQGDFFGVQLHVEWIDYADYAHLTRVPGHSGLVPVFCVNDIGEVWGDKPESLLRKVPKDEKLMRSRSASGQSRKMWFVTKQGLYRIIMRSHHPDADRFIRWITYKVLPDIENTGLYSGEGAAELGASKMTVRAYVSVRGLSGSVSGFGHTVAAACRRDGTSYTVRRRRGHEYPVAVMDRAAGSRPAARGPLSERPGAMAFFYDRSAAEGGVS